MLGRPSIVVCAGMPRSASTWLYNTLRYLLGAGGEPAYGAWIDDYDPDHPSVVHVVKVHRFTPDLAATGGVVLTTRRDLRDIAASLSRRNWATADNLMVKLGKMVSDHQHWLPYSAYEVAYERMMPAKALEIARLADVLGLRTDPAAADAIHRVVEGLDHRGDGLYDKRNLLHRGHVQDGRTGYYREVLAADLVERINAEFGPWLARHGYALDAAAVAPTAARGR